MYDWLVKSRADLRQAQSPIELGKTLTELATWHLQAGNRAKARDAAVEARQLCKQNIVHGDLTDLIRKLDILPAEENGPDIILERYVEMMKGVLPCADEPEMLLRLITSTSRFFESERGGVFESGGTDARPPRLITGYNLIPEDVTQQGFTRQIGHVKEAFQKKHPVQGALPLYDPGVSDDRRLYLLCLPFQVNGVPYVLYFDNAYSEGRYRTLAPTVLSKLADYFGTYLAGVTGFSNSMKEISRQAIVKSVAAKTNPEVMVSRHAAMEELLLQARQTAPSEAPVLILGETGVGKELLAHFIHDNSPRRDMPFIAVNFSSIPENLLESELFGHEKGAFTGAVSRKPGLMELADKGTLFIDEVGDIPKPIQVKLLRALQEKTFMRVGGINEHSSDFRIIAATHMNMKQEVSEGNFREDLYYRLNIIPLTIPPLRERGDDVIELANYFLARYSEAYNRQVPKLTPADLVRLRACPWTGNVRELRNVMERAVILSTADRLELAIPGDTGAVEAGASDAEEVFGDELTLDEVQRRHIRRILNKTNGKVSGRGGAVHILGINRTTLYSRMRKLGMDPRLLRKGEQAW